MRRGSVVFSPAERRYRSKAREVPIIDVLPDFAAQAQ
jgi:hypothetical protein